MIVVEHEEIELDYCTNCNGVWFDSGELELLLEAAGLEGPQPLLDEILNTPEATTSEKKRKCPICGRKMKKVNIGENSEILVDISPEEHGLWFDGGEVAHLIGLLAGKTPGEPGSRQKVIGFLSEVFKVQE
jgi:Zn-finger nucleic acid-binding protein